HGHERRGSGDASRSGRRDQSDLRRQPTAAAQHEGCHVQPGARPLPGAHRHPVRQPGPAAAARAVAAAGADARNRPRVDHHDALRTTQEAMIKAQLRSIGIAIVDAPLPPKVVFGTTGIPSSNYDLANFAWITATDPAAFAPVWGCGGESNYLQYCNRTATQLLDEAAIELDPKKRAALFQTADALFAKDLPSIPPYSRPNP